MLIFILPSRILALLDFCRVVVTCELCHSLSLTQQEAMSALAVAYVQVPTLKTARAFACKDFLLPNHAGGMSFIILPSYILVFALKTPGVDRLTMNIISHPAVRRENHSFIMPRNIYLSCTYDPLTVKIISHPAVRMGNHSSIMPRNIYPTRTRRSDFFFFFILGRMGKKKALAHHTSTYFHTRRVSI